MQELDENEREALRLKFSMSYSNAEIAQLLKIDPAYLGVIIFRALRKLRRKLEGSRS
jgi:DNA-directed RNA polymerase specialized sigma24 family protein